MGIRCIIYKDVKSVSDVGFIELRSATMRDLELLLYWETQQHVIDASGEDCDWNWDYELRRDPPWREQLVAERGGNPIGYVEIIDPAEEEDHYWGDVEKDLRAIDIWIGEKEDIRKGYGTEMMRLALERCFSVPQVKAVIIDPLESNTGAQKFYEFMGFVFLERRTFDTDKCIIYRLEREGWVGIRDERKGRYTKP